MEGIGGDNTTPRGKGGRGCLIGGRHVWGIGENNTTHRKVWGREHHTGEGCIRGEVVEDNSSTRDMRVKG